MKTLLLLRHAKSSWKDKDDNDFDRPLNQRGMKAAPAIGRTMSKRKLRPGLVLSSPAERARQTIQLVIEGAGIKTDLRYDERIYEATGARLFEIVTQLEDDSEMAMLVGHNPGLEELLEILTGESHRLPTGALVCIELDIDKWSKCRAGAGRQLWLLKPRNLKSG
jgi:phosphohistidine phosphatase